MKRCVTCKQTKQTDQFNKNQDRCRECCKEWYKKNSDRHKKNTKANKKIRFRAKREAMREYLLSHPCIDCGEVRLACLEFDHVRGQKTDSVANMLRDDRPWEIIEAEIAKCDVRCANCHRIKTASDFGWWKSFEPS